MVKKHIKRIVEKGDKDIEKIVTKPGKYVDDFAGSKHGRSLGAWAFIIGFVIALIAGIVAGLSAANLIDLDFDVNAQTGLLTVIGLVVGLVNVKMENQLKFLVASIAIILTPSGFSALGLVQMNSVQAVGQVSAGIAAFLTALTGSLAVFVAPAAVIVAIKAMYSTARGE